MRIPVGSTWAKGRVNIFYFIVREILNSKTNPRLRKSAINYRTLTPSPLSTLEIWVPILRFWF